MTQISAATCPAGLASLPLALSTSLTTTLAPRSAGNRVCARPLPVTMATLPSSRMNSTDHPHVVVHLFAAVE